MLRITMTNHILWCEKLTSSAHACHLVHIPNFQKAANSSRYIDSYTEQDLNRSFGFIWLFKNITCLWCRERELNWNWPLVDFIKPGGTCIKGQPTSPIWIPSQLWKAAHSPLKQQAPSLQSLLQTTHKHHVLDGYQEQYCRGSRRQEMQWPC